MIQPHHHPHQLSQPHFLHSISSFKTPLLKPVLLPSKSLLFKRTTFPYHFIKPFSSINSSEQCSKHHGIHCWVGVPSLPQQRHLRLYLKECLATNRVITMVKRLANTNFWIYLYSKDGDGIELSVILDEIIHLNLLGGFGFTTL